MAMELEKAGPQEPPVAGAAMDFIGLRRARRAAPPRQDIPAGPESRICRKPGLVAPATSLAHAANRPLFDVHAPPRCSDCELHRDRGFTPARHPALSSGRALPGG